MGRSRGAGADILLTRARESRGWGEIDREGAGRRQGWGVKWWTRRGAVVLPGFVRPTPADPKGRLEAGAASRMPEIAIGHRCGQG